MSPTTHTGAKLSLTQKVSRLGSRLKSPEWRRYGAVLALGKVLGIGAVLMLMQFFTHTCFTHVLAQTAAPPVQGADCVNPINTAWTLVAAYLVFCMQVGFTMLEAGFCRSRETVNVLMECIVDTCLCGLLFYAIGFSFMFSHGNGFIGYHWFFLQNAPLTYESTGVGFLAFWIFQFAFADTCFHHLPRVHHDRPYRRSGLVGDLPPYSSASPASSTRSSVTGHGVRMASSPAWVVLSAARMDGNSSPPSVSPSMTSPAPPSFTPSAA